MAARDVRPRAAAGEPFVAEYVADLASRLRGPRRRTGRILDEIADGLGEAISTRRASGYNDEDAKSSVLHEFGAPPEVADAFRGELLASTARWACAWLLITGPLVGVGWLFALSITPWEAGVTSFLTSVPVAPVVAGLALLGVAVLARTGHLTRWIRELSPPRARMAARALAAGCILVDASMIGLALVSGGPITGVLVLAVLLSSARIGCCVLLLWKVLSA